MFCFPLASFFLCCITYYVNSCTLSQLERSNLLPPLIHIETMFHLKKVLLSSSPDIFSHLWLEAIDFFYTFSIAASRSASIPVEKSKTPPGSPWWSKIPWRKKSTGDYSEQLSLNHCRLHFHAYYWLNLYSNRSKCQILFTVSFC